MKQNLIFLFVELQFFLVSMYSHFLLHSFVIGHLELQKLSFPSQGKWESRDWYQPRKTFVTICPEMTGAGAGLLGFCSFSPVEHLIDMASACLHMAQQLLYNIVAQIMGTEWRKLGLCMWGVVFFCSSIVFTELSILGQRHSVSRGCVREDGWIPSV